MTGTLWKYCCRTPHCLPEATAFSQKGEAPEQITNIFMEVAVLSIKPNCTAETFHSGQWQQSFLFANTSRPIIAPDQSPI
jgi:hypothetical protein